MANNIKSGFIWTALEKFSIQIVQFVLGIIIARFVSPSEYGILGVIMVFITISQVFIESGLGSAIIYKNDLNEKDLQTVFSFNLYVSIFFVLFIYLLSGLIESFFETEGLSNYLAASIIVLIINALQLVPTTILRVKLNFKAIAISNFCSTLLSGILGAIGAFMGYGVWALIIQLLSKSVIQVILVNLQCKWIPNLKFYKSSFVDMYKYSISIFGTSCITKLTTEGLSFFIAKILTPYNLGIFTRSNQFASLTGTSIGSIFNSVLFPAFSSIRNDKEQFYNLFKKTIVLQGLLVIPCFSFLALFSKPIIIILLTDKWSDVILILQILCIGRILSTVSIGTEQALCAVGRSDLLFKQQYIKIFIKIVSLIIGFNWGLIGVALADAISTLLSFFSTNYVAKNVIEYGSLKQLKLLTPFLVSVLLSSLLTNPVFFLIANEYLQLIIGGIIAVTLYIGILRFIDKNTYLMLKSYINVKMN